ncbi:Anti-FecI sigma factor FecR [Alloalcanivorax dieselolei B5]|uniref:Anti-FecI sigma factor FecR n=1 Tax=Alcanivorax dieselolei (strain DSM 16502 / CGMCC 1.3690 / MCCC 1A00001 / B-5) TaxID=930169 RepID=K0CA50_ALCDB|nr:FecR domain-containing protein [Alloalcanivorax dieselolei]AFT69503.1 Anti-FecI sigma factor FecR [Alloalcanivorax dieselolei B5]GGK10438.1 sensor [Alloalcanivorax dieselolei]
MTERAALSEELKNAIRDAARWYAVLQSPEVTRADQRAWQHWLTRAPSHRLAWREVERVQASMTRVPGAVAAPVLRDAALSRRELLNRLGMIAVAAPLGLLAWRLAPWQQWQAQYTTATGEQRPLVLADGSQLMLNTATRVDVDFSANHRRISLHRGEILVQTAPDPNSPVRPFLVDCPQGRVQALGTRFLVRREGDETRVTVLEKAVRVRPSGGDSSRDIHQGEQLCFTRDQLGQTLPARANAGSWVTGNLMVVDMPLRELLHELGRYRQGHLSCGDAIADLKISGSFPLSDTDRALNVISQTFPVRQFRLTAYWVTLVPG